MNENDFVKKMRADSFVKNNGVVLRAINIGRITYNRLDSLRNVLSEEMDRGEFADCINYLSESGYINLRRIDSKESANIADNDADELEAKVSPKGIRILAGRLTDDCIRA